MNVCHCTLPSINPKACDTCPNNNDIDTNKINYKNIVKFDNISTEDFDKLHYIKYFY